MDGKGGNIRHALIKEYPAITSNVFQSARHLAPLTACAHLSIFFAHPSIRDKAHDTRTYTLGMFSDFLNVLV